MISQLTGILIQKQPPTLVVDVHGVGYEVLAPMSTCYALPECNQSCCLLTYLLVREDVQQLYGFLTIQEKKLFTVLLKISGVGPKLSLAILSAMMPDHFIQCVQRADALSLTKIPGVGKAVAERLIVELRRKLGDWHIEKNSVATNQQDTGIRVEESSPLSDAMCALIHLGYKPAVAKRMLMEVKDKADNCEQLIRLALKHTI